MHNLKGTCLKGTCLARTARAAALLFQFAVNGLAAAPAARAGARGLTDSRRRR